jgi:PIN domain nuclease of toxin-antitoxin system
VILLDTHAWIWHLADRSALSEEARNAIDREYQFHQSDQNGQIAISAISVWELFTLVKKRRLELTVPPAAFVTNTRRDPAMTFVPIDESIARRSVELVDVHQDPADRFILSTAIEMGWPLVSRDQRFPEYEIATVIW